MTQNNISEMRILGDDLALRWKDIFVQVSSDLGFVPDWNRLRKSEWWKTGKIGAVSCHGVMNVDGQPKRAVLKIQGTKTMTSEVEMIKAFEFQNKSSTIRPPKIYGSFPWDDEKQFEVLVMEEVNAECVITRHPAPNRQLSKYFNLYSEYRKNCRSTPWVKKPDEWSFRRMLFKVWMPAVEKQSQSDVLKNESDLKLVEKGIRIIESSLTVEDLEFVHGHFQPGDLLVVSDKEVVLFSNLAWSWRVPFYDAVFGYHWWMLGMEHAKNLTTDLLEQERRRWLEKIFNLSEIKGNKRNIRLVKLALLERAIPALMVDRYMMNPEEPSYEIITESARKELKRLVQELL